MLFFGSQHLTDHLSIFFFFGVLGIFLNVIAYKKGFFSLPNNFDARRWFFKDTIICFVIYLSISFYIAPLLTKQLIKCFFSSFSHALILMTLQTLTIFLNICALGLYLFFQNRTRVKNIWKDQTMKYKTTIGQDLILGFFTWFLAFPVVVFLNQICEVVNKYFFRQVETDQVAVQYLKQSTTNPSSFYLALFAIIIAAPFIEEFIFRGCLQNTLRQALNRAWAIVLSSLIFAIFHFSPSQKASNFPLLISLFVFSLYLGFLYEKKRSLLTSIALHMTFNAISVIRIIF